MPRNRNILNMRKERAFTEFLYVRVNDIFRSFCNNAHSAIRKILHFASEFQTACLAARESRNMTPCTLPKMVASIRSAIRYRTRIQHESYLDAGTLKITYNTVSCCNARLAQLVEQLVYTEKVGGSSPSARTRKCAKVPKDGETLWIL